MAVAHAHPGTGRRAALDELIGAWLPVLAAAGRRLEHPLTAIATNGKRLRGAGDGAGNSRNFSRMSVRHSASSFAR